MNQSQIVEAEHPQYMYICTIPLTKHRRDPNPTNPPTNTYLWLTVIRCNAGNLTHNRPRPDYKYHEHHNSQKGIANISHLDLCRFNCHSAQKILPPPLCFFFLVVISRNCLSYLTGYHVSTGCTLFSYSLSLKCLTLLYYTKNAGRLL